MAHVGDCTNITIMEWHYEDVRLVGGGVMDINVPPLDNFDRYFVGLSGGKDSTAVALWTWFESSIPHDKITIGFCDTSNEDSLTYAFIWYLATLFPIQVILPERDFWQLARWKKRFPSRKAQFCTQFLKIIPIRKYLYDLRSSGLKVLKLNGVRREEGHSSNDRGEAPSWEFHDGDLMWTFRPIVDWTLDQVWDMHRRYLSLDATLALIADDPTMAPARKAQLIRRMTANGIPRNPLYDMGAKRVGCFPCINSNKPELRALTNYRPEQIDFLEEKEHWVGETNRGISTFFPIRKVPDRYASKHIETKDGRHFRVPTIRDVAEWAKTARGGKQYDFDLADDDMPVSLCDLGGSCE